jgi:hypothetical protein
MCPLYTVGGKMSDKNLEHRIYIRFCVKIGKRASETLALLTVTNDEYAKKKSSVLNNIGGRNARKDHPCVFLRSRGDNSL